jgi:hypothetical protein
MPDAFEEFRKTKSIGFIPSVSPFGKGGQGDFEIDFLERMKMLLCVFPASPGSGPGQAQDQ